MVPKDPDFVLTNKMFMLRIKCSESTCMVGCNSINGTWDLEVLSPAINWRTSIWGWKHGYLNENGIRPQVQCHANKAKCWSAFKDSGIQGIFNKRVTLNRPNHQRQPQTTNDWSRYTVNTMQDLWFNLFHKCSLARKASMDCVFLLKCELPSTLLDANNHILGHFKSFCFVKQIAAAPIAAPIIHLNNQECSLKHTRIVQVNRNTGKSISRKLLFRIFLIWIHSWVCTSSTPHLNLHLLAAPVDGPTTLLFNTKTVSVTVSSAAKHKETQTGKK